MTRDDARAILENLAVISHYAAGGNLEYPAFTCEGEFIKWWSTDRMSLCCLGRYKITGPQLKARIKVNSLQYADAEPVIPSHKTDKKKRDQIATKSQEPQP